MLRRSFGASSFAGFWRHWNPIFGYTLGRYVFAPAKRVLPPAAALVFTFVVCGAVHDLVTTLVRGSWAFLFTPWFFFLGIGVVLGRLARMDLGRYPWAVRASAHLAYIAICLALALVLRSQVREWLA
jgi:D-alanyl-lipoteichoic acid acyltransferase DltB (MBOAT superfamily)